MSELAVMSGAASPAAHLVVSPVRTRKQRKQFLMLPWTLYRGDPNWIPPLLAHQRELLNYKHHPFYENAAIETFVAYQNDEPVGRIAAIVNHAHNERYGERRGFFGFFESIDDQAVADALLAAAKQWWADHNLDSIRGPANPSLNYEVGLLVDGFETPPYFMMSYNKPYYERLLEGCGLRKTQDLYAFWGHVDMLATLDDKVRFVAQHAAERFNVHIRNLDPDHFAEDIEKFLDIYNRSLVATWGFVPLSEGELKHMATGLKRLIIPELTVFTEIEGQTVGAAFCLPDYNSRIKQIDGRLFPFGFIKLLRHKRSIKRFRVLSANVIPEFQRWGLGIVLMAGLVPKVLEYGIQEAEFSWVLESNTLSRATCERAGAKLYKTYRMYDGEV
jgi:GNAT superfamily N-acetyltransferase